MGKAISSLSYAVERTAPLNIIDCDLRTAAKKGYLDLCRTLVKSGADVKAIDSKGRTVLHYAVASDSPDVIKYLIEAGCETDVADKENRTALDLAVDNYELNATCTLDALDAKMDMDHPNYGWVQLQPWSSKCMPGPWNRNGEFVPGTLQAREATRRLVNLMTSSGPLPNEITDLILDRAEFWQRKTAFEGHKVKVPDYARKITITYLQTEPLGKPIKKVTFKIRSHDQGWSSYPQDQGTYRNSWTWFEAAKLVNGELIMGPLLATNRHADKTSQLSVVTWSLDDDEQQDPDGAKRKWVQELQPGDCIAIMASARYPCFRICRGWQNTVECAEIVTFSAF